MTIKDSRPKTATYPKLTSSKTKISTSKNF